MTTIGGSTGEVVDLVVIGSGAAGLTAAVVAATEGLRVLVLERAPRIGGTTARSGGAVWVPGHPYLDARDRSHDCDRARCYLDALVGGESSQDMRDAFLRIAPEMIDYLDCRCGVRFSTSPDEPDYRTELPGASSGGRVLRPSPYDGRRLGASFKLLEPPLRELMLFGGMMVTRSEANRLMQSARSFQALRFTVGLVGRYAIDRMRHERGTRLVLGNALVASLFAETLRRGVAFWTSACATSLSSRDAVVRGVTAHVDGRDRHVEARLGVVLAGGGFPASAEWRRRFLPHPVPMFTPAFAGCDGTTLALGQAAGARLSGGGDNALWFPSSVAKRRDGSYAVFPHIADRAKPGIIAVDRSGRRFVNEAVSYHEFVRSMYHAPDGTARIPAWLICDRRFISTYGLGLVLPRVSRVRPHVDSGYLTEAPSLEELARRCEIDPRALVETVERHNGFARSGMDEDFGKGLRAYDRSNGDPSHAPNPCLGAIGTPPFYAVQVLPTPLGTCMGLQTNENAQVLGASGDPIDGLYACGNDMASVMGGQYPGAGAQIGPGMAFAYQAARNAAKIVSGARRVPR